MTCCTEAVKCIIAVEHKHLTGPGTETVIMAVRQAGWVWQPALLMDRGRELFNTLVTWVTSLNTCSWLLQHTIGQTSISWAVFNLQWCADCFHYLGSVLLALCSLYVIVNPGGKIRIYFCTCQCLYVILCDWRISSRYFYLPVQVVELFYRYSQCIQRILFRSLNELK